MQKIATTILLATLFTSAQGQGRLTGRELSINGFRNPSVGAELRINHISAHAGYYPTAFKSGENTSFLKIGATCWFLPVGKQKIPSSFYAGASYLRGFNRDYESKNALGLEAGFRWTVWKGLNLRLGAIAVAAEGRPLKINPTPGISYSIIF